MDEWSHDRRSKWGEDQKFVLTELSRLKENDAQIVEAVERLSEKIDHRFENLDVSILNLSKDLEALKGKAALAGGLIAALVTGGYHVLIRLFQK